MTSERPEKPDGAAPTAADFPRQDWDQRPWSDWSFLNTRHFLRAQPIRRGPKPLALPRDEREIGGIGFRDGAGGHWTVDRMIAESWTNGFMVVHRGRIVHESYPRGMAVSDQHLCQSVSKAIVSAAAGTMIAEGRLDPDAPVTDYLPELATTAWRGARLRHVLDMTTGVRFIEDYEDPMSDMARTDVAAGWRRPPDGADPAEWPRSLWAQILALKTTDWPHGEQHCYRSIEADVLGLAMARMDGAPLEDVISRRIWAPMGAEADASVTVDTSGVALADAGVSATLRDLARFGLLLLNEGMAGDRRVLPADWVDELRRGDGGLFDDVGRAQFPNGRFRSMFWVEDRAEETLVSQGTFGQLVYIVPELDLVAVKLSSWERPLDDDRSDLAIRAIKAIGWALS